MNVISRGDYNYNAVAESISQALYELSSNDETTMAKISKAAINTASQASWSNFIDYYDDAFVVAIENAQKRNN